MPYFRFETNLPKSKITDDFLNKTIAVMATTLGKPENNCKTFVLPDLPVSWGGTTEPCGIGTLISIGKMGPEENKKHTAAFCDHIEKTLGIPADRVIILFVDEKASNIGTNRTTFQEILGAK